MIADDHAAVRSALCDLLQGGGIKVIGEAANGEEAVRLCQRLRPDIVVLDISMPLLDGFEAAQQITILSPDTKIMFLTGHIGEELEGEAFRVGGMAFVRKQHAVPELIKAIEAVLAGKSYVSGESAA